MPFPRAVARCTHGFANEVALSFVGQAAFADLEHVGRQSGTVRHTPLRAFRTKDTVVIGLNFGRESDWFKIAVVTACAATAALAVHLLRRSGGS